jgi:hypothetical protein
MKHKHYDCIVAWAEGKDIQFKAFSHSEWEDVDMKGEEWYEHYTYRIKPEPKPDFYRYLTVIHSYTSTQTLCRHGSDNVKFTYDGETGKLKAAEVL